MRKVLAPSRNAARSQRFWSAAFTLTELIVVIVIVAILAAIAVVAYNTAINNFENSAASSAASEVTKLYTARSTYDQLPASALSAGPEVGQVPLSSLPYQEDLPSGLSSFEVTAAGDATVAVDDKTCTGVNFSTTSPGVASGQWTCTDSAAAPTAPFSVSYASTQLTIGSSSQALPATISSAPGAVSFAVTAGQLPEGVTLNAATGELTGPSSWPLAPIASTSSGLVRDVALGQVGDIFVAGGITDTSSFAGASLVKSGGTSSGYVVKMSDTGEAIWGAVTSAPAAGNTSIGSVSPTSDGGAIVSGVFDSGDITLGATTLSLGFGSASGFVAKVSALGAWEWALGTSTPTTGRVRIMHSNGTPDDGVILTGFFDSGDLTLGALTVPRTLGTGTGFAAKVSSAGAWEWAIGNTTPTTGNLQYLASTATPDGGAVMTGFYNTGDLVFGGSTLTQPVTGNGLFVAKVSSAGAWQWAASAETDTGATSGRAVAAGSDGSIFVGGQFQAGSVTIGGTTLPNSAGLNTAYLAKLSSAGAWQWASGSSAPGTGSINPASVVATSDGGALLGGLIQTDTVTFGPVTIAKAAGTQTLFVVKADSAGDWVWGSSSNTTGASNNSASAFAALPSGDILVGGYLRTSDMTLGSATVQASAAANTGYVATLSSSGQWHSDLAGYSTPFTVTATSGAESVSATISVTKVP